MTKEWSEVKIDAVNFRLGAIIDEWAKDHGWHVVGGETLLPDYYLEIAGEPLEQAVEELRLVFYDASARVTRHGP